MFFARIDSIDYTSEYIAKNENDVTIIQTKSFFDFINALDKVYPANNKNVVKSIYMNNIVNIVDDRVSKIRNDLADTIDEQKKIVINEIERTKQYLEVLNKLL